MIVHTVTADGFFIAHGPSIHYGDVVARQEVATGQASLEVFADKSEYVSRLLELGVTLEEEE